LYGSELKEEASGMLMRLGAEFASIDEGVAGACSPADGERVMVRNGAHIVIRPLVSGDEAAIGDWFAGLGAETRYARFLAPLKQLDRRTRSELARVDHVDHEAIVAVDAEGTTIGIARHIRIGQSSSAEVAVAVADAWRGQGIAGMLLDRVASRARSAGIETFKATCLATNHTVIRLLRRLGATTIGESDAAVVDVRIDLRTAPADAGTAARKGGGNHC
jgi:GNAT superfamily N-acetyltransferase